MQRWVEGNKKHRNPGRKEKEFWLRFPLLLHDPAPYPRRMPLNIHHCHKHSCLQQTVGRVLPVLVANTFLDSTKRRLFAPLCAVNACWLPIFLHFVVAVYFDASHPRKGFHPVTKQKTYFPLPKRQWVLFLIHLHRQLWKYGVRDHEHKWVTLLYRKGCQQNWGKNLTKKR